MTTTTPLQILVIDDSEMSRSGLALMLERCPAVEVLPGMDFVAALATENFVDTSLIFLDLSQPARFLPADHPAHADEYMGAVVLRHIRRCLAGTPPVDQPAVIVTTGQEAAWVNDLLIARLISDGADGLVHTNELPDLLGEIVKEGPTWRRSLGSVKATVSVSSFIDDYGLGRSPRPMPGSERRADTRRVQRLMAYLGNPKLPATAKWRYLAWYYQRATKILPDDRLRPPPEV